MGAVGGSPRQQRVEFASVGGVPRERAARGGGVRAARDEAKQLDARRRGDARRAADAGAIGVDDARRHAGSEAEPVVL